MSVLHRISAGPKLWPPSRLIKPHVAVEYLYRNINMYVVTLIHDLDALSKSIASSGSTRSVLVLNVWEVCRDLPYRSPCVRCLVYSSTVECEGFSDSLLAADVASYHSISDGGHAPNLSFFSQSPTANRPVSKLSFRALETETEDSWDFQRAFALCFMTPNSGAGIVAHRSAHLTSSGFSG